MSDSKKGGWQDSNWYVSLSGFWREYRKHKIGILGIIVLFFYIGMAFGAPMLATHNPSPNHKVAPSFLAPGWMAFFDPGGVTTGDYMPDPDIVDSSANNVQTRGLRASEFSSEFNSGSMELSWTHSPASLDMDWRLIDPTNQMPDSNSFIFFTQEFEWEYNRLPSDVNMTLELAVTTTGSFSSEENGGLMFKIYMWLIDPSGNWQQIYRSFPPYTEIFQSRRIDLNYFDMAEGWRGMIEDENGVQEDPDDILTVAIGLAPTDNFRADYNSTHTNEEVYDGSVTVHFERVNMLVFGDYFGVLGSTDKGGDAWSQLVYGSQVSLTIGILATALSTAVGVIVGLVAGYFGGKIDESLMRFVDFLLVIPSLPLMMVLAAFLGPTIQNIILVIAILGWTGTSRLIRSQVMAEKNKAYVESAKAIGASDTYIIFRHVLPNVTPI
ncbi:MAG: ABC transporter permease, partial [Candidatus Thorarchaeota archaeon]